eukprot:4476051-Prymnesium_polylepis.1
MSRSAAYACSSCRSTSTMPSRPSSLAFCMYALAVPTKPSSSVESCPRISVRTAAMRSSGTGTSNWPSAEAIALRS